MTADETDALLAETLRNFDDRHRNLPAIFERRAAEMEDAFTAHKSFSQAQRQLVGAYFLHEYSFEAAALFNPSIVPHPRSEERREGKECVSTCRSRWSPSP